MTTARETAIETRGLVKRYGNLEAVRGIDLDVASDEIFGFLGPNGAGKSTTINILCTLLKPTAGTARVAGIDVRQNPGGVRARIGLVFQDPSLDDRLTARENLEFHAYLYGLHGDVRRKRIDQALEMVDLANRASSLVETFSGGMKRRLEIARGVLHYPHVLFLDEPTLGLDPQTRAGIWQYLHELRKREHICVFMTTHYMEEAEFCDRIGIIDHGQIVALGTPEQLKEQVGGDVVSVVTGDNTAAARQIDEMFHLHPAAVDGSLQLEVDDGAAFVPQLIHQLTVPVQTVSVSRPTLETVFLKLTGRTIREEEAGHHDQMRAMAARWRRR